MSKQLLTAIGNVATEPKLFTQEGGVPFCTFRMACNHRHFDTQSGQWQDGETNWYTIKLFRNLALNTSASVHKGDRIIVHGSVRIRDWENENRSGSSVEIDALGIGHDLLWGISAFTRQRPRDGELNEHEAALNQADKLVGAPAQSSV